MKTPYFIYFGNGKFLPLLKEAMTGHDSVNTQPSRVLTDLTSNIPPELEDRTTRVDPKDFMWFVREGNRGRNFDYKSAIILAFLRIPQENRFYLMDCDQAFRRNIDAELAKIPDDLMGMVDEGSRNIPISQVISRKYKIGNSIPEMTSSFMLFPADSRHIGDLYVECVKNTVESVHFLLEQRTWSVVWRCLGGHPTGLMPKIMNWSRFFGEETPDVCVRHYHGNEKWTTVSPKESEKPWPPHPPYGWPVSRDAVKKNPEIALRVYQNEL